MYKLAFKYRNEFFLITQLLILFGSIGFDAHFFETILSPLLFIANILAGIVLISKKIKLMWFFIIIICVEVVIFGFGNYTSVTKTISLSNYLKTGGRAFFEIGMGQLEDVSNIFNNNGFIRHNVWSDLNGHNRVLCVKKDA